MATLLVVIVTVILPFTTMGEMFGFTQLSSSFHLWVGVILVLYIITAEMAKAMFHRRVQL